MVKAVCIMMQKDEAFLLRPWLAYHGYLFGFENLVVLDNGSTLPEVRATLAEYERKGVKVDWTHTSRQDYLAKGDLIGSWIKALDTPRYYDFLIPLDCDEFIVLRTEQEFSCTREDILAYLTQLIGSNCILRFPYQLANHPLNPDIYHWFEFFKIFFPAGTFSPMDHGHHVAEHRPEMAVMETQLIHLHFHYKVFDLKIAQAREGWAGTMDVDDRDKLARYTGPSAHLAKFFLQDKKQYYRSFLNMVHFYLPQFRVLLNGLGAPLDLPVEPVTDDLEFHVSEVDGQSNSHENGAVVIVPTNLGGSNIEFRATRFHEGHYLAANPSLAEAGVNPLTHFCMHGFREGRPLRPADTKPRI
jgi:hypothetical protein